MNNNYEYFETMADMGIIGKGNNLEEAFINCAKALTNLMVDINTIEHKIKKEFTIESDDLEGLLYDFLTELLILLDSEYLIFSKFKLEINKINKSNNNNNNYKYILHCVAYGEKLNKIKHNGKEEVKAITYHKMEIKKDENNKYIIKLIVDL